MVIIIDFGENIRYAEKEGSCGKEFTLKSAIDQ